MINNLRNNYISIAKAIGIILMVVGHSGCPIVVGRFIYLFHMPLFFVCSGYFFKKITNLNSLNSYYLRKIKGLYFPYLKWSFLFLFLHNIFKQLHITDGDYYQLSNYIRQFCKIFVMTDYELLIRPFWFIKELLMASFFVALLSLIRVKYFPRIGIFLPLLITIAVALASHYIPKIPIIGDCSLLFLSIAYIYSGMLLHKFKNSIPFNTHTLIITFLIVLIGSLLLSKAIDMRYSTVKNMIPYYLISISGVIMVLSISKLLDKSSYKSILYYIGNHTMPILALNLLALKLGNLIKIWIYDLPMDYLSAHTVIYDYNTFFWPLYTLIGVSVPLLAYILYNRFFQDE